MALMPSEDVIRVLHFLGMAWPEANEDQLWQVAGLLNQVADNLLEIQQEFQHVSSKISENFTGSTADAFVSVITGICAGDQSYLAAGATQARQLAQVANDTGTQVQYTKWEIIGQAVALIAQMAIFSALSFFFGPEVMLGMTFEYAAVRELLMNVMMALLKSIAVQAAIGAGVGVAMSALIQEIQISEHHRSGMDLSLLSQSAVSGALGAAFAAPFGMLGMGLGKLLGNIVGKLGSSVGLTMNHGITGALGKLFGATGRLLADDAAHLVANDAGRMLANDAGRVLANDAASGVFGLARGESAAFAKDFGSLLDNTQVQFFKGFGKQGVLGGEGTIAHAFTQKTAGVFEKHLGGQLGPAEARKLGGDWARTMITHYSSSDPSHTAVKEVLTPIVSQYEAGLGRQGVQVLTHEVPDVLGSVLQKVGPQGSFRYRVTGAVAGVVTDGISNDLSGGVDSAINGQGFSFTGSGFLGGMAMGGLGRAIGALPWHGMSHAVWALPSHLLGAKPHPSAGYEFLNSTDSLDKALPPPAAAGVPTMSGTSHSGPPDAAATPTGPAGQGATPPATRSTPTTSGTPTGAATAQRRATESTTTAGTTTSTTGAVAGRPGTTASQDTAVRSATSGPRDGDAAGPQPKTRASGADAVSQTAGTYEPQAPVGPGRNAADTIRQASVPGSGGSAAGDSGVAHDTGRDGAAGGLAGGDVPSAHPGVHGGGLEPAGAQGTPGLSKVPASDPVGADGAAAVTSSVGDPHGGDLRGGYAHTAAEHTGGDRSAADHTGGHRTAGGSLDEQSHPVRDETVRAVPAQDLVDRLVHERDQQRAQRGQEPVLPLGASAPGGRHGQDAPLRAMTDRERQEWVQLSGLSHARAEEFLHVLHEDLGPSFQVSEGAQQHFAPVPSWAEHGEAASAAWHGEQVRMASRRDAELAEAQREASRQQRFEDAFDQWAGKLVTHDGARQEAVHRVLDWAEQARPAGDEASAARDRQALLDWSHHELVDDGGLRDGVRSRLYESTRDQVRRQLDDGGPDVLDTPVGLADHLERQWVIEHGVAQVNRFVDKAFEQWKGKLDPYERQWLEQPHPAAGGSRGAQDEHEHRQPEPTPAEQAHQQAVSAFQHRVRDIMSALETPSSARRAGSRQLVSETALQMDIEIFGLHGLFERAQADGGALGHVNAAARNAVGEAMRDLRAALPELQQIFEHSVADQKAYRDAGTRFESAADQHSARRADTVGAPAEHNDAMVAREQGESRLSEGGRERLRRQWLEEFGKDRLEIFGEPGGPSRRDPATRQRWHERRLQREQELPGRIELQVVKEEAAREAVEAVKEAASSSWKQALDGLGEGFRDQFARDGGEAGPTAQRAAALALGDRMHQELDRWAAGESRDPSEAVRITEDHTRPEHVRRRVALAVARAAAQDTARSEASEIVRQSAPLAPKDATDRFIEGHIERTTQLFDSLFAVEPAAPRQPDISSRLHAGNTRTEAAAARSADTDGPSHMPSGRTVGPARIDMADWHVGHARLNEDLSSHLEFELSATSGMNDWADGFHASADGRGVGHDDLTRIGTRTGEDWFTTYHRMWKESPKDLDTEHWLAHEQVNGRRFAADIVTESSGPLGDSALVRAEAAGRPTAGANTRPTALGESRSAQISTVSTEFTGVVPHDGPRVSGGRLASPLHTPARSGRGDQHEGPRWSPSRPSAAASASADPAGHGAAPAAARARPRVTGAPSEHVLGTVEVLPLSQRATTAGGSAAPVPNLGHRHFEVSRVEVRHGGVLTEVRAEVVLRVHLEVEEGVSAEEVAHLQDVAAAGVERFYNAPGHRLPNGDLLHVEVQFVKDPQQAHETVAVSADESGRYHSKGYYPRHPIMTAPMVLGHELGHLLAGWRDEYREGMREPRAIYDDSSLMSAYGIDRWGHVSLDMGFQHRLVHLVNLRLQPRHLNMLGVGIEAAWRRAFPADDPSVVPAPPEVPLEVRERVLRGNLATGLPGRLAPRGLAGRARLAPVGERNPNGTYRAQPAEPGSAPVMMFPDHWSLDEAVYAIQQVYVEQRRAGGLVRLTGEFSRALDGGGGRARPAVGYRFEGVYQGVRFWGVADALGRITDFGPHVRQHDLPLPAHLVPPPPVTAGGPLVGPMLRQFVLYGDQFRKLGGYHQFDTAVQERAGIRWNLMDQEGLPPTWGKAGIRAAVVQYLDPNWRWKSEQTPSFSEQAGTLSWADDGTALFSGERIPAPVARQPRPVDWAMNVADGGSGLGDFPQLLFPSEWNADQLWDAIGRAHDEALSSGRLAQPPMPGAGYLWEGVAVGVRMHGYVLNGEHVWARPSAYQPMWQWDDTSIVATLPATTPVTVPHADGRSVEYQVEHVLFAPGDRGLRLTVVVPEPRGADAGEMEYYLRLLAEVQQEINIDYNLIGQLAPSDGTPLTQFTVRFGTTPGSRGQDEPYVLDDTEASPAEMAERLMGFSAGSEAISAVVRHVVAFGPPASPDIGVWQLADPLATFDELQFSLNRDTANGVISEPGIHALADAYPARYLAPHASEESTRADLLAQLNVHFDRSIAEMTPSQLPDGWSATALRLTAFTATRSGAARRSRHPDRPATLMVQADAGPGFAVHVEIDSGNCVITSYRLVPVEQPAVPVPAGNAPQPRPEGAVKRRLPPEEDAPSGSVTKQVKHAADRPVSDSADPGSMRHYSPESLLPSGETERRLGHEQADGRRYAAETPANALAPSPEQDIGYGSARDLLADLVQTAAVPPREGLLADGPSRLLGFDYFGLRDGPAPPEFLRGHDYSGLTGEQALAFLAALDMTEKQRPTHASMAPDVLETLGEGSSIVVDRPEETLTQWAPGEVPPLPQRLDMPVVMHTIWLGGPLRDVGTMKFFRSNVGQAAQHVITVLWTDVPRSAFEAAGEPAPTEGSDPLADVRDMLAWAKSTEVMLLNVDEVFNSATPMFLQEQFKTETAKQVGPGFAAASDILRMEILHRFGGIYSDGDNKVDSLQEVPGIIASPQAYATHKNRKGLGNSAFVMPKGHPFARLYLDLVKVRYDQSQFEVFPDSLRSWGASFFTTPVGRVHRNSVTRRTGPELLAKLAFDLGYENKMELPGITGIEMRSDGSWLKPQPPASHPAPADNWDKASTLELTKKVVHTLVRELYNREGDVHLTLVEPVVNKHPRPELVWTAALGFLAHRPELASSVREITDRRLEPHGEQTVTLPPDARALFDFTSHGGPGAPSADGSTTAAPEPRSWLGEYQTPARMRGVSGAPGPARSGHMNPDTGAGPDLREADLNTGLPDAAAPGHLYSAAMPGHALSAGQRGSVSGHQDAPDLPAAGAGLDPQINWSRVIDDPATVVVVRPERVYRAYGGEDPQAAFTEGIYASDPDNLRTVDGHQSTLGRDQFVSTTHDAGYRHQLRRYVYEIAPSKSGIDVERTLELQGKRVSFNWEKEIVFVDPIPTEDILGCYDYHEPARRVWIPNPNHRDGRDGVNELLPQAGSGTLAVPDILPESTTPAEVAPDELPGVHPLRATHEAASLTGPAEAAEQALADGRPVYTVPEIDQVRPVRVERGATLPELVEGPSRRWEDGALLPAQLNEGHMLSQGEVTFRGVPETIREIEDALRPLGLRPGWTEPLGDALNNVTDDLLGDGYTFEAATRGGPVEIEIRAVNLRNWDRFRDVDGSPWNIDRGHSTRVSQMDLRTVGQDRKITFRVPLGPGTGDVSPYGSVTFAGRNNEAAYGYNSGRHAVSIGESRAGDGSHVHTDDLRLEITVRGNGSDGRRSPAPLAQESVTVHGGLRLRLPDSLAQPLSTTTDLPTRFDISSAAPLGVHAIEAIGPVEPVLRAALDGFPEAATIGSSAYRTLRSVFSAAHFVSNLERMRHGWDSSAPLYGDSSRTRVLGSVRVRAQLHSAELVSVSEDHRLRSATTGQSESVRAIQRNSGQSVSASVGPSVNGTAGLLSHRIQAAVGFAVTHTSGQSAMVGGTTGQRRQPTADGITGVYRIGVTYSVQRTGRSPVDVPGHVYVRLSEGAARRIAGLDGDGQRTPQQAPYAPDYLPAEHPDTLGPAGVRSFTGVDDFRRSVVDALAGDYPGLVAPWDRLDPHAKDPNGRPLWSNRREYRVAVENTLRLEAHISREGLIGGMESLLGPGLRLPLRRYHRVHKTYVTVTVRAKLANRQFVGTDAGVGLRMSANAEERADSTQSFGHTFAVTGQIGLLGHDQSSTYAGGLSFSGQWAMTRGGSTSFGQTTGHEGLAALSGDSHVWGYDVEFTAEVQSYQRPRFYRVGPFQLAGASAFVAHEPRKLLVPRPEQDRSIGRVELWVPSVLAPKQHPDAPRYATSDGDRIIIAPDGSSHALLAPAAGQGNGFFRALSAALRRDWPRLAEQDPYDFIPALPETARLAPETRFRPEEIERAGIGLNAEQLTEFDSNLAQDPSHGAALPPSRYGALSPAQHHALIREHIHAAHDWNGETTALAADGLARSLRVDLTLVHADGTFDTFRGADESGSRGKVTLYQRESDVFLAVVPREVTRTELQLDSQLAIDAQYLEHHWQTAADQAQSAVDRSSGTASGSPASDAARRPWYERPHVIVATPHSDEVTQSAIRQMGRATGDSWQYLTPGASAHDSLVNSLPPEAYTARFDDITGSSGLRIGGLYAKRTVTDRMTTVTVRGRVGNLRVVGEPMDGTTLETDVQGSQRAFGGRNRSGNVNASVNLGPRIETSSQGRPTTGSYLAQATLHDLTTQTSDSAGLTAAARQNRIGGGRHVLVRGDVDYLVTARSRRTGVLVPSPVFARSSMGEWALGSHTAGERVTVPDGVLMLIPEHEARQLARQDELTGLHPPEEPADYGSWSLPEDFLSLPHGWLMETPLDFAPAIAEMQHHIVTATSTLSEHLLPRDMLEDFSGNLQHVVAVSRAAGSRGLIDDMVNGGVAVRLYDGRQIQISRYPVTWAPTSARLVISVELGQPAPGRLGQDVSIENSLAVTRSRTHSESSTSTQGIGLTVSEAPQLGNDALGMQLSETAGRIFGNETSGTDSWTTTQLTRSTGPTVIFDIPAKVRLSLRIDDPAVPAVPDVVRDAGHLRAQVPLSAARAGPAIPHPDGTTAAEPQPQPRLLASTPGLTALTDWQREGGFGLSERAHVCAMGGVPALRNAAALALAAAEGMPDRAGRTGLTRPGHAPGEALQSFLSHSTLRGGFGRLTGLEGLDAPRLTANHVLGGTMGKLRVFARPDLACARLLSIRDDITTASTLTSAVTSGQTSVRTEFQSASTSPYPVINGVDGLANMSPAPSGSAWGDLEGTGQTRSTQTDRRGTGKPALGPSYEYEIPVDWRFHAATSNWTRREQNARNLTEWTRSPFGNVRVTPAVSAVRVESGLRILLNETDAQSLGLPIPPRSVTEAYNEVTATTKAWTEADAAFNAASAEVSTLRDAAAGGRPADGLEVAVAGMDAARTRAEEAGRTLAEARRHADDLLTRWRLAPGDQRESPAAPLGTPGGLETIREEDEAPGAAPAAVTAPPVRPASATRSAGHATDDDVDYSLAQEFPWIHGMPSDTVTVADQGVTETGRQPAAREGGAGGPFPPRGAVRAAQDEGDLPGPGADAPAEDAGRGVVPVVRRDDAQRGRIAGQLVAGDVTGDLSGVDLGGSVSVAELTSAGVALTPEQEARAVLGGGLPLAGSGLAPVDQVRLLMLRSGPWPQALNAVAARAARRIWESAYEDFAAAAEPGVRAAAAAVWGSAARLVLPLEPHPVLADSRYAGQAYREAVRQVADVLLAGRGQPDTGSAMKLADQLRHDLGLRPRLRGGAGAPAEPAAAAQAAASGGLGQAAGATGGDEAKNHGSGSGSQTVAAEPGPGPGPSAAEPVQRPPRSPSAPFVAGALAHAELSRPEPLDRREFAKQAISSPVPGSGHRPPLTVHASEHGTETEAAHRWMVPDALDIERLHAARTPGDPAYREGWDRLTPSQSWALLAAEQRGELFHAREREAFEQRIRHFNASARTRYPVDDPARMDAIVQAAHDHVRSLRIASNYDLAARPAAGEGTIGGAPTLAEAITSDGRIRNFWDTGITGGTPSRAGRGWVEELQGYGAALRRTQGRPQDGLNTGEFDPVRPGELPKYAALVSPAQKGGTSSYGSTIFYWKESVRSRVTHTPDDSAGRAEQGVLSYTDNAHVFPLLAHGDERRVRLALAEATRFSYDPELAHDVRELGYATVGRYFETQIHGDLSLADVERIVVNWGGLFGATRRFTTRAEAESLAAYLRGQGLPVELGREIGFLGEVERLVSERLHRLYDPPDGVGLQERALSEALDRLASPAPFQARATRQALVELARSIGATDTDPDRALLRLWQIAERARDVLLPGGEPGPPGGSTPEAWAAEVRRHLIDLGAPDEESVAASVRDRGPQGASAGTPHSANSWAESAAPTESASPTETVPPTENVPGAEGVPRAEGAGSPEGQQPQSKDERQGPGLAQDIARALSGLNHPDTSPVPAVVGDVSPQSVRTGNAKALDGADPALYALLVARGLTTVPQLTALGREIGLRPGDMGSLARLSLRLGRLPDDEIRTVAEQTGVPLGEAAVLVDVAERLPVRQLHHLRPLRGEPLPGRRDGSSPQSWVTSLRRRLLDIGAPHDESGIPVLLERLDRVRVYVGEAAGLGEHLAEQAASWESFTTSPLDDVLSLVNAWRSGQLHVPEPRIAVLARRPWFDAHAVLRVAREAGMQDDPSALVDLTERLRFVPKGLREIAGHLGLPPQTVVARLNESASASDSLDSMARPMASAELGWGPLTVSDPEYAHATDEATERVARVLQRSGVTAARSEAARLSHQARQHGGNWARWIATEEQRLGREASSRPSQAEEQGVADS